MSENDELLPEFIAESADMIEQSRADIQALESESENKGELLNSIFRTVHTIKGGAGIFNYENTKRISHKLENLLDSWRKNPETLTDKDIQKITKVIDHIETLLLSADNAPDTQEKELPSEATSISPSSPSQDNGDTQDELSDLSKELAAVAAEPAKNDLAKEKKTAPINNSPALTRAHKTAAVEPSAAPPAAPAQMAASTTNEILRVPIDRVQRNLDIISEVFLIRNQMTYLVEKHFSETTTERAFVQAWEILDNSLRRSIGELEGVAMSMRMMSLNGLFSRMEKTVRAYTDGSSKKISFIKSGEQTELDKKILDALAEPLIHLIRNAMDHGIESPQERINSGKTESGTIRLSAKVAGNEVLLTIEDDGKGMDPEKIKASALAKGLDASLANDEKSSIELIFLPGFSTASSVTETSGRGVGMDVVKSSIEKMGGSIEIHTVPGSGSTFTIHLPLSMSVIPAIVVKLNETLYAVSTNDIIETKRIPSKDIKNNAGESYLSYRGKFIPCYNLEAVLQGYDSAEHPYQSTIFVCIVKHKDSFIALQVGALESNTEIVVKPMPALSPHLPYVTGISVLATGQPVFVLSLGKLYRDRVYSGVNHEAA